MQTVVSIDADYFVYPALHLYDEHGRPAESDFESRWGLGDIKSFVESQLHLEGRCMGVHAEEHDAIYTALSDVIARGVIKTPFRLVHIDAHADLAIGEVASGHVLTKVLHEQVAERADRAYRRNGGRLGPGNWLLYAIANHWVAEVVLPSHRDPQAGTDRPRTDLPWFLLNDAEDRLVLRPLSSDQWSNLFNGSWKLVAPDPPPVPLAQPSILSVQIDEPPDFLFVCRSPDYLPRSADPIFELLKSYVR